MDFPAEDPVPAAEQAEDPITAAEQALVLGEGAAVQPVPGISILGILRMVLTLAVVAVAIYGLVFIFKRAARPSIAQDPFLKILSTTMLAANRSAHVIALGSRAWLVGSSESGVSLISEIEDKDIIDAMLLEDSRKSAATPKGRFQDFKTLLRRFGVPTETGTPGPENIRSRRERLRGL